MQLVEKRKEMMLKWDERWDWLRLCKSTNVIQMYTLPHITAAYNDIFF